MEYREMKKDEIIRIGEVNREESIDAEFITKRDNTGFGLVTIRVEKSPIIYEPSWGKQVSEIRIVGLISKDVFKSLPGDIVMAKKHDEV